MFWNQSMNQSQSLRPTDSRDKYSGALNRSRISEPGLEVDMVTKPDHGEETYVGHGRLLDRVALITGGDSGIGRAIALSYAREGANVAISYLEGEQKDAEATKKLIEDAGRKALLLPGDIQSESHCKGIVKSVLSTLGRIDVLVNNAAYQKEHEDIADFTTDEFLRTFTTNVFAMFWLSKFCLPKMKPGSSIINTASIQAFNPSEGLLPYAATKAAIINFTKGLSKSAIKNGVRVNAVAPGPVWTPLIPSTLTEDHLKNFGKKAAFERPAQPAELAPLYVFLASEESSYMTGEVMSASGGNSPV